MDRSRLIVPAGALILGSELGLRADESSPFLAAGLAAAGLAARGRGVLGRVGPVVCAFAAGWLTVAVRPAAVGALALEGPVTIEGGLPVPWRRDAFGWSTPVRLERVVVGDRVLLARGRVWVALAGEQRPPFGSRIRATGMLRPAASFHNGGATGRGPPRMRIKSRRLLELSGSADGLRQRLHTAWEEAVDDPSAPGNGVGLARALVLGDASSLGSRLRAGLRRAGLAHLLALSGLHVGILAAAGLWIGRALGGGWRWVLPALASTGFLVLAGARPAIVRASMMGALAWTALAWGARPLRWHALGLVAAGMVLWQPDLLRDLGFQLTIAATVGIVWALEPPRVGVDRRRSETSALATALRVGLAAQLFTLPWSLRAFSLIAPAGLVHNLWAVPWTAGALLLGVAWLGLTAIWASGARATGGALNAAVAPFELLSRLPAGPWFSVPLAVTPATAVVLCLLGAWALRGRSWTSAWRWTLTGAVVAFGACAGGSAMGRPELVMLDVGQGEALLVRDGRRSVLIDGGGWTAGDFGGRVLVPALARLGVRRLSAVVMTHPDHDHCGGLVDVLAYVPVRELWASPGWNGASCFGRLATQPRVARRPVWSGRRLAVGRWRLAVLHPAAGDRRRGNDRSLVVRAEVFGFRALLTGDIESAAEHELIARAPGGSLRADLLKVAHHGSRTSTTEELLAAVSPRLAWISAGRDNHYGHPSESVVERLRASGARVLRTDRDGQIRLEVDADGSIHLSLPGSPP